MDATAPLRMSPGRARIRHLAVAMLVLLATPAQAAVIDVGPGGCSLDDAIRAANADAPRGDCPGGSGVDTIRLPEGATVAPGSALPTISSPLTLTTVSGRASIDGGGSRRVLRVDDAGAVTIEHLTLANGRTGFGEAGGAGLLVQGSTVTLRDLRFSGNRVEGGTRAGGGLRVVGGEVLVEDSEFMLNKVEASQTATSRGGNIDLVDSTAEIRRSTLRGYLFRDTAFNYLTSSGAARGAGIHAEGSTLRIESSLLFAHVGSGQGVDLYLVDGSSAEIANTTIHDDLLDNGGRIYVEGGELHFNNATVRASVYKAGITARGATVSSSNSLFVGNAVVGFCRAIDPLSGDFVPFSMAQQSHDYFADPTCAGPAAAYEDIRFWLDPPADHGGPTLSMRLRPTPANLAINGGDPSSCEPADQRGVARGASCDVGAYEFDDEADLEAVLTRLTPPPHYAGQRIHYQVEVHNHGPADATEVDLVVALSGSNLQSLGGVHDCSGLACEVAAIPSGGSATLPLAVAKDGQPAFDATLTVNSVFGPAVDPDVSNNIDDQGNGGSLVAASDLSVSATLLDAPPFAIGQVVDLAIEVRNDGPSPASALEVAAVLEGMDGWQVTGCSSFAAGVCSINALSVSGSRSLQASAEITAQNAKATLSVSGQQFDPQLQDNEAAVQLDTENDAKLAVGLSVDSPGPYFPYQPVGYTVLVVNGGPDTATGLVLETRMENGAIIGGDGTCPFLPCEIASLAAGTSIEVSLLGEPFESGSFTHEVSVFAVQNDDDLEDNVASLTRPIAAAAEPGIDLSLLEAAPHYANNLVSFDALVANTGPGPASDVSLALDLVNLELLQVDSLRCPAFPCQLGTLDVGAGSGEAITFVGRIIGTGSLGLGLSLASSGHDIIASNNIRYATGIALRHPSDMAVFADGFDPD